MPIFSSQYPANSNPAGEDKILTTDTSDADAVKSVTLTKLQEWLAGVSKWVVTSMIADGAVTPSKLGDTGWVSFTGGQSGVTFSDGGAYRKIGSTVYFRGAANYSSFTTGGDIRIAILPVGFRPPYNIRFTAMAGGANTMRITIDTSGNVNVAANNTNQTYSYINTVQFQID